MHAAINFHSVAIRPAQVPVARHDSKTTVHGFSVGRPANSATRGELRRIDESGWERAPRSYGETDETTAGRERLCGWEPLASQPGERKGASLGWPRDPLQVRLEDIGGRILGGDIVKEAAHCWEKEMMRR